MTAPTDLTEKQQKRLNNLIKNEPLVRVVGWSYFHSGPIICRTDGTEWVISVNGRMKKITEYIINKAGELYGDYARERNQRSS